MAKSYVPEGTFTACNYGTSPNQIRVTNNENVSIYALPMATEVDFVPYLNVKPNGVCLSPASIKPLCSPLITGYWEVPKDGVKINGKRLLLIEDSQCKCTLGGIIKLFPDRDAAVSYGIGEGKLLTEYIEEGFDWVFENMDEMREKRDSFIPDVFKPAAHFGDWVTDATIGLGEGLIDGVVGLGELAYQVNQDPVGMGQALWGMGKDAYHATVDGAQSAYNWAKDGDNWRNAASSAWDWAQDGENWQNAISESWEGVKDGANWIKDNPRAMGKFVGQFIPDMLAAYFSGGTSLGASALRETAEAGGEAIVREAIEELGEQGVKEVLGEMAEGMGDDFLRGAGREAGEEGLEALARGQADNVGQVITKTLDDKVDEAIDAFKGLDNPSTAQKGNFGEMVTDQDMIDNGLEALHPRVDDLDSPMQHGIDGVFRDPGPPPKYYVVDSKYGSANLSTLTDGTRQMSNKWIDDRLANTISDRTVLRDITTNGYERLVAKVDDAGNVVYKRVDENGYIIRGNAGKWP